MESQLDDPSHIMFSMFYNTFQGQLNHGQCKVLVQQGDSWAEVGSVSVKCTKKTFT